MFSSKHFNRDSAKAIAIGDQLDASMWNEHAGPSEQLPKVVTVLNIAHEPSQTGTLLRFKEGKSSFGGGYDAGWFKPVEYEQQSLL